MLGQRSRLCLLRDMSGGWEESMELTLRYRGRLPSTGSVRDKQALRLALSPQLGDFWGRDRRYHHHDLNALPIARRVKDKIGTDGPIRSMADCQFRYQLGGIDFIPLVTDALQADCALSIRIHRPQDAGSIIYTGGDLDNRLKTLFDALRMPRDMTELDPKAPMANPGPDSGRVFCLLQGDELITKITIDSKRLLGPPVQPNEPNYVEMDIDVTILMVTLMAVNSPLLGR